MKRTILALSVVALLGAAPAGAQDLSNYVALGDSMIAGFAHLGLMDCYQERTWPALVAREAGVAEGEERLGHGANLVLGQRAGDADHRQRLRRHRRDTSPSASNLTDVAPPGG